MNFADLLAAFGDLRHACDTQLGTHVLPEIGLRGPAGKADEAAFLRLTAWCYALFFENGRILVPYLLEIRLPGLNENAAEIHKQTIGMVHSLRTWLFHNLTSQNEHDQRIRIAASNWFLATCNSTSPQTTTHWNLSFDRLCQDSTKLVQFCTEVVSAVAATPLDKDLIVNDLKSRLSRDWPAHQFDELVNDAASRFGETINAKAFRERRIADWRKLLSTLPDDADLVHEMERVIDAEVIDHFRSRLPVTTRELMQALDLDPGPQVRQAVEILRRVHDSGVRDVDALLAAVRQELIDLQQ